jgi:hypothetical protein
MAISRVLIKWRDGHRDARLIFAGDSWRDPTAVITPFDDNIRGLAEPANSKRVLQFIMGADEFLPPATAKLHEFL